ncbi:MAG TPA: hypothetical protein VMM15_37575 [Bradyrhizobium sp.]|nr:hypothetical protein [Bradyrhizobium sp.]
MKLQDRAAMLAVTLLTLALLALATHGAFAQAEPGHDVRDITVGMPVDDIPNAGYVNLTCAGDANHKLTAWSAWRECPADADALRGVRFDFDPQTSRDGTLVGGHPVLLTVLIDDTGTVAALTIETDPKARLYMHKKAFLLGVQVKSRYGSDGWACTQGQPELGELPVGGVYLRESCRKAVPGRVLVVERDLFRRPDQDVKNFVDQTQVKITREPK